MRISIDAQREVLRLVCDTKLTNRAIGRLAKTSHNTVRNIRHQLEMSGESWAELKHLDDQALESRLYSRPRAPVARKTRPQWLEVHEQLKQPDATLEVLWQEFREGDPNGVSYTQFTRLYREWVKTQKVSMRQVHLAGDKCFVDFCGRTMPITDPATGGISRAQVFVATLGASGYIFATAVASQTIPDWLKCHARALEFFDGVPRFVVPDNLKSAVIKTTRHEVILNRAYADFSEHYGFRIFPARPRKPQDKSLAEIGVKIVQRFILARLRTMTFFSIDELNEKIDEWVGKLNDRITRTYPKSRLSRYLEVDHPALQPLPEQHYSYSQWEYQVRVGSDYHVTFEGRNYSVPYHYSGLLVDLRVHADWLEIVHQRRVISTHKIDRNRGVSTLREHLAPNHSYTQDSQPEALIAWAESIGPATLIYTRGNLNDRRDFSTGLKAVIALKRDVRKGDISPARLESACAYANTLNILSSERLRSIIRNESDLRPALRKTTPLVNHQNIRGAEYYASQGDEPL
ncbi:IS21 family transposase (plasmid) [Pseudomonas cannabina pv. alisalensis]|uniref:IS21 family transposase n=1 Tax=Pseudomonas syringae pv. maculicola str. ES4326 TaxID=629265 RepID=A0A8T8CB29_PSEYM|nr:MULTISPECIES: IS21 family transposase [Pseudomonas syringae group]QHF00517.1 IS21 family transposase [Pseudomonas syringae pv. maculicola str. ES4326]QHF00678.1 IS21 family transposase [Pseudomonas syringae pv. maculicola str. ES4326]UBZ00285.1 IS21 family transposase [Pseudomonas cannabina pv. alisalensis]UBZ00496.1 IS21 family transposase [Pseudomonas cannabina pv. alisalensis]